MSASLFLLILNLERRLLPCEMIRLELVEEVEDLDVGKGSSVGIDNVDRHNLPSDYHPFHPFPPTFSSFLSIPTHNEPRWVTPPVMVKKCR